MLKSNKQRGYKCLQVIFLEEYIMKKIAILRCLKTSASCAGAGCLRALYEKDKAFAQSAAGG